MKLRFGFGYEQAFEDDAERMYGFYIWDADTGLVLMSEDVRPTQELIEILQGLEL